MLLPLYLHAVRTTEPRWRQYDVHWADVDRVYLSHAYEQGGFELFAFLPLLDAESMGTIPAIGSILASHPPPKRGYDRSFAGSLDAPFYADMVNGSTAVTERRSRLR